MNIAQYSLEHSVAQQSRNVLPTIRQREHCSFYLCI